MPQSPGELVAINLDQPPRLVFLGNGRFGPHSHATYRLSGLWAAHVYQYTAALRLDGGPWLEIKPGSVGLTPPGVTAEYRWHHPNSFHGCAHFALATPRATAPHARLLTETTGQLPTDQDRLQAAIGCWPVTPARATALVWNLLWRLIELARSADQAGEPHPAVRTALAQIERHLADPLTVRDIVAWSGVSHNHLTRLFQQTCGTTVIGYLRQRRANRARQLLTETDRPAKAIAVEVGVPDLQQFNKLIRQHCGRAPRELRARQRVVVSRPAKR